MDTFYLYDGIPKLGGHKAVAEIDTDALRRNYDRLCDMSPNARHICVVKADAYGHTCEICVPILLDSGCDFFAVSCIEEAITVRKICNKLSKAADILILGYTLTCHAKLLCDNDLIQTVLSVEYAERLDAEAKAKGCCVRAHIALDTGMNRIGLCAADVFECDRAVVDICALSRLSGLRIEGMFTHFAKADEPYDSVVLSPDSYTLKQISMFSYVRDKLSKCGIKLFSHACNSAATVRFSSLSLDAVRFGILLYGVQPSENFCVDVRPVMSLKTVISHINHLKAGRSVSYNGIYIADTDKIIATLPIGYADGVLRAYSGCEVVVNTKSGDVKARIIGRICMDQCMIDITDAAARVGDTVTVFGSFPNQLDALSKAAETIEYESLCSISARVPRIIKNN